MKQPDECGSSTDEQSKPEDKYSRLDEPSTDVKIFVEKVPQEELLSSSCAHEPVIPFLVHSTLNWAVESEKTDDKIETSEPFAMNPDVAQDECLKQSTTKNVGGNQRILHMDSPRKDPVLLTTLDEDPIGDNRSQVLLPSTLLVNEANDDSIEILSNSDSTNDKQGKCRSIQNEDIRKSSLKGSHLKLEEIKCKSCKSVLSTREALKMHTCYSILDRIIQSDGGTRRNASQKETKIEVTPSTNAAPKSTTVKTKSKKKSNLIIQLRMINYPRAKLHRIILKVENKLRK